MLASLLVLTSVVTCQLQTQTALVPQTRNASLRNDKSSVSETAGSATAPYGMIFIPAGEVVIGTEYDKVERLGQGQQTDMTVIAAETPRHSAEVGAYFLDQTEVTNLQWKVFLEATGREPSDVLVEFGWPGGEIPDGQEYFPITNVNLPEIQDYLAWSGKRLPTEEEWTRAARGDDTRDYAWGERWNGKLAKYGGNPPLMPVSVDSYDEGASPYGVLNMTGNVFEWTASTFTAFDGFEPIKFKLGKKRLMLTPSFDPRRRVIKGGSFNSTRDQCRIDFRYDVDPAESDASLGFRAARSINPGEDLVRHGYSRILPPRIPSVDKLDGTDVFCVEDATFMGGTDGRILEGYRFLAFAHPTPDRQGGLASMRRKARDEHVTLGLLTTSEPLLEPPLPAGDYVIAYKAKGESKKAKARRKDKDLPPPIEIVPNGDASGGMTPWPGVAVNELVEDIAFPQDKDVFLFFNVNDAVVGWLPTGEIVEEAKAPIESSSSEGGKAWTIEFSLDVVSRRVPRFTLPVKLKDEGIGG